MGHETEVGVPNHGIANDFPLLWAKAQEYDFAERLGGCSDPLMAEIDAALRECWDARRASAEMEERGERLEAALREIGLPAHVPQGFDPLDWWRHTACKGNDILDSPGGGIL